MVLAVGLESDGSESLADPASGDGLSCEVNVARVSSLSISTTTREMVAQDDEIQWLEVEAHDAEGNTFSSPALQALAFRWVWDGPADLDFVELEYTRQILDAHLSSLDNERARAHYRVAVHATTENPRVLVRALRMAPSRYSIPGAPFRYSVTGPPLRYYFTRGFLQCSVAGWPSLPGRVPRPPLVYRWMLPHLHAPSRIQRRAPSSPVSPLPFCCCEASLPVAARPPRGCGGHARAAITRRRRLHTRACFPVHLCSLVVVCAHHPPAH
jgi:hypothetical protein